MRKIKIYKIILAFLLTIFSIKFCFAALPIEIYQQRIKSSKIKAIAIVKNIKTVSESESYIKKQVIFKLEKSIGNTVVPKEFSGYCESVVEGKLPAPGYGPFFYPKENEKVFVTIINNDGDITSYTILSPKLETKIINNFEKMKYGIDRIYYN